MHPANLEVVNFGSFENGKYEFSTGLFLIEGCNEDKEGSSNGSGKSIFFTDALTWVLYEQTCRGTKFDDVIRKGSNYTECSVVLKHGDSKIHILRRKDRGKGSQLYINKTKATQEELEKVVGLDYNTFTASVVHAQLFRGFADRSETEQKTILTTLLGLEEWDAYKKKVGNEIILTNKLLTELEAKQVIYAERVHKLEDVESLQRQADELEELRAIKLQNAKAEILSLQENKEKLEQFIRSHPIDYTKLDTLNAAKAEKNAEMAEIRVKLDKANKVVYTLKAEINRDKSDIEQLTKEALDLKNLKGNCPVCRQKISEKSKANCIKEVQSKINDLVEMKCEKTTVLGLQSAFSTEFSVKLLSIQDELEEYDARIKEVELHITDINNKILSIHSLDKLLEAQYTVYDEIESAKNPHLELLNINKEELKELKEELEKVSQDVMGTQELLRYYEFWDEGFSNKGIKSYIFDTIIPEFTEKANRYIQLLTNASIKIHFDTQREKKSGGLSEKFTIKLMDDAGERPYSAWSGGEKKRIAVAIDLALSDLVLLRSRVGWDFVIFDEVFDSLDEEGKEMMVYLLEGIMKERERVFVISHDSTMRGMIDNLIQVVKRGGKSYIV